MGVFDRLSRLCENNKTIKRSWHSCLDWKHRRIRWIIFRYWLHVALIFILYTYCLNPSKEVILNNWLVHFFWGWAFIQLPDLILKIYHWIKRANLQRGTSNHDDISNTASVETLRPQMHFSNDSPSQSKKQIISRIPIPIKPANTDANYIKTMGIHH